MKQNKHFEALFDADEQTVSRIAAQCEPDWDENRLFERSYQKYQARKRGTVLPPPRRSVRDPLRALVTAACLMIAVSGAGGIWFFRYGVQKPQMTVDVETAPTDRTETTAQTTAAVSDSTAHTDSHKHQTEPPETVPVIWATATALHTTASETAPAPASETSVTARETAASTVKSTETRPAASGSPQTQRRTESNGAAVRTETSAVQTAPPTEPPTVPPTEPPTAPPTEPPTEPPAEETAPSGDLPMGDPEEQTNPPADEPLTDRGSFTIQEQNGWINIRSQSEQRTDLNQMQLSLDLDGFTVTEKASGDYTSRLYTVHDTAAGEDWDVRQFTHGGFSFSYRSDTSEVLPLTVDGHPAYLIWQRKGGTQNPPVHEDLYSLFWDDGTGICLIQDVDTGGATMLKIAEAIIVNTTGNP